jgi:SPP1 family predicted phage head-tail adaptor
MLSKLTQRAALQSLALVPDGAGGSSATWESFAVVWASVEPLSGNDVFGPDADETRVRVRIAIRRRSDVAAGQRVVAGGRAFLIHAVLDDGPRAQFLTLLAETTG